MTVIRIVSPITVIPLGTITLEGDHDTSKLTVNDVKVLIQELTRQNCKPSSLSIEHLKLWWRGYLLDDNSLAIDQ